MDESTPETTRSPPTQDELDRQRERIIRFLDALTPEQKRQGTEATLLWLFATADALAAVFTATPAPAPAP